MGQHRSISTAPHVDPPADGGDPGADVPRLKSTHRPLWRGPTTVQLGIDPDRAVVLAGLSEPTARVLRALDHGRPAPLDDAMLVRQLASIGALDTARASATGRDSPLAPERSLLGLLHPDPGAADAILSARREARVLVIGGGRTGAAVAHVLAASGIGRVTVEDANPVRPTDACPGGVSGADVGLRRGAAATALAVRTAPPTLPAGPPDVAVLCPDGAAPPDPARWWPLLESGSALLCAVIRASVGIVGPFTLPYGQCCPGCLTEHRTDRDPAWPLVERQLADPLRTIGETAAATAVLAVASAAASQVLAWIDSGAGGRRRTPPPATGCTLELPLPGWRWRRRPWGPHSDCRCADLDPPAC